VWGRGEVTGVGSRGFEGPYGPGGVWGGEGRASFRSQVVLGHRGGGVAVSGICVGWVSGGLGVEPVAGDVRGVRGGRFIL